jgi:hypothetical protein
LATRRPGRAAAGHASGASGTAGARPTEAASDASRGPSRSKTLDAHPAITSTIIGVRTRAQLDSALPAADVKLEAGVLDAIDAVVPQGSDAPGIDHHMGDPSLQSVNRRRLDGYIHASE